MKKSFIVPCVVLAALIASYEVVGDAHGAPAEGHEITTQIINSPGPVDRNGACSKCLVNTLAQAQDATEDGATLELYYDDERITLHGYVELTILLADGTYHVETVPGVELKNGQVAVFELGPQVGWSWRADVEHLWVEVVAIDG
ncbi:MAG: hypothetical protein AAGF11_42165 [Myxococcota bacterium]